MASWRGAVTILQLLITGIIGVGFLFPTAAALALILTLSPTSHQYISPIRRAHRHVAELVQLAWLTNASFLFEFVMNVKIRVFCNEDGLKLKGGSSENAIILCNHRTRIDWIFIWHLWNTVGDLRFLKIVLKDDLKKIPIFGWAMQCFCFMFMTRKAENDLPAIRKLIKYFELAESKISLLIFPEGTDLHEAAIQKSHAFSEQNGLPKFDYVLIPRTTGFMEVLNSGKDLFNVVYDVTVAYVDNPKFIRPNEKSIPNGTTPLEVWFSFRRYSYSDIPKAEPAVKAWLQERFIEKENYLRQFYLENDRKPFPGCTPFTDPFLGSSKLFAAFGIYQVLSLLLLIFLWKFPILMLTYFFALCIFFSKISGKGGMDIVELSLLDQLKK